MIGVYFKKERYEEPKEFDTGFTWQHVFDQSQHGMRHMETFYEFDNLDKVVKFFSERKDDIRRFYASSDTEAYDLIKKVDGIENLYGGVDDSLRIYAKDKEIN